jgi:hypothetical protein
MYIVGIILYLIFLCGSILVFSSFPISVYQKTHRIKKAKSNHYYNYLFDVYDDNNLTK